MPAAEWLLDNFYLIEEQIRTAKRHLPKGYSRELPRLSTGLSAHLPRVYDLAFEAISHGDGRIDAETLSRFIAAYQTVTPLKVGELWAFPIMLRLALIENLRRVGARIAASTIERNRASAWADQMMEVALHDPKSLILVIADMARSSPPLVSSFVAELARRLQGHSAALALPLTWVEQCLAESGLSIEQMVQLGTQEQAGVQVSISNTIGSLRFLGSMDWRDFVESMSIVEKKLREDPGGLYGRMDFSTRDRYRHVIEEIAKGSPLSESEVARKAIQLAHEGASSAGGKSGDDERGAHVGYYLVDKGRPRLERAARMRLSIGQIAQRVGRRAPLLFYLGTIAVITATLTVELVAEAHADGVDGAMLVLLGILLTLASSQLAVSMVNWLATLIVTPQPLPRMDFSEGLPPQTRTLVVVPTLLTSPADISDLVEALEVRFLANRDEHVYFGLLTDFVDAPAENLPEDVSLVALARQGIEALNQKYAEPVGDDRNDPPNHFFLFHRPRRWNAQERRWMGFERKRGKLADLNALLRGDGRDRFSLVVGNIAALADTKYVITLDTDTQLPRDSARQFVGVMAHPLNRARFGRGRNARRSSARDRGLRHPPAARRREPPRRESLALRAPARRRHRARSLYPRRLRRLSGRLRRRLVHRQGDLRRRCVRARVERTPSRQPDPEPRPDRRLLRALGPLERCPALRGASVDVSGRHEPPASLDPRSTGSSRRGSSRAFRARVRAAWPIRCRRCRSGSCSTTCGEASSHRRSRCCCCSAGPRFPTRRCGRSSCSRSCCCPGSAPSSWSRGRSRKKHHRSSISPRRHPLPGATQRKTLLTLAFLPYEAVVNSGRDRAHVVADARHAPPVARVEPVGDGGSGAPHRNRGRAPRVVRLGRIDVVRPGACRHGSHRVGHVGLSRTGGCDADPRAVARLAGPRVVGEPAAASREANLATGDVEFLREARAPHVGLLRNVRRSGGPWLPPDNEQEHPVAVVAHRTSPTNMGLSLLANLTAYDFGFIPAGQLIERTGNALATMSALERHEGHFYNWYDTQSGKPLPPLYVSSVDSGNLAGHLMTLRSGLTAVADDGIIDVRWFEGLSDTAQVLVEAIGGSTPAPLSRLLRDLGAAYDSRPATIAAARQWLDRIGAGVSEVAVRARAQVANLPEPLASNAHVPAGEAAFWTEALVRQCRTMQEELALLAPWSALAPVPDELGVLTTLRGIPTLREVAALEEHCVPFRSRGARRAPRESVRRRPMARSRARSEPGARARESPRSSGSRSCAMRWREWTTSSSTIGPGICSPSAITLPSGGGTQAITICSPRKRALRASSASPRASCRRRTGSRWGACSRASAASGCSCRGADRCSST
jgi:hypothetical protein